MRCQPGTFGAYGVFGYLDNNHLSFMQVCLNGNRVFFAHLKPIGTNRGDISIVKKCRPLQSDINKRRLHAWHDTHNLAEVDISDKTTATAALQKYFLQQTVFDERQPGLPGRYVD